MFTYSRAGLALNKLITAVEKKDKASTKKALAKLVRFDAFHIVDNFLGNLKVYLRIDPSMSASRTVAALQSMELLEEIRPDIANAFNLRKKQAQAIDSLLDEEQEQEPEQEPEQEQEQRVEDPIIAYQNPKELLCLKCMNKFVSTRGYCAICKTANFITDKA